MITNLEKLKQITKGKTVLIMLHGKSIEGLENIITDLKDKDIVYASLNYFDLMENFILSKINKKLSYVLDCAGVKDENLHNYNVKRRIPRLKNFFACQENKLLLTIKGVIRKLTDQENCGDLLQQYKDKILVLDSVGIDLINVPNSASILIGITLLARAKKIIICGMDGYLGKPNNSSSTYYQEKLYNEHKRDAFGNTDITHVNGDTQNFGLMMPSIIEAYCNILEIESPEIYNCSPNSIIDIFPKINYNQLKNIV